MSSHRELADRAAAAHHSPAELERVGALARAIPANEAGAAVETFRSRILELVRSAPAQALPVSEILLGLAEARPEHAAPAHRGRAVALHANSRSAEALPHYERAAAAYDADGDMLEAARVRRSLVDVRQMNGDPSGALADAERAREVFVRLGENELLAQLECNVGNVHFRLDHYREAAACYRTAIALFDDAGNEFGAAFARFNLGNVQTNAHDFEAAGASFARARSAFEAMEHHVLAADSAYGTAYLDFRQGHWTRAIEALEALKVRYEEQRLKPSGAALCDLDLAEIHLRLGAVHDAARHAERAAAAFDGLSLAFESAKARVFLGLARAEGGAWRDADAAFLEAIRLYTAVGNRIRAALVTLHRATLAPPTARARKLLPELRAAAALLAETGDPMLARAGALGLAEVQLAAGDPAAARESLDGVLRSIAEAPAPSVFDDACAIEAHWLGARAARAPDGEKHLRDAIRLIERTYGDIAWADARLAFFGRRQPVYVELAALLLERDGVEGADEALAWIERGCQRSLREDPLGRHAGSAEIARQRRRLESMLAARMESTIEAAEGTRRVSLQAGREDLTAGEEHELSESMDRYVEALRQRARSASSAPEEPSKTASQALGQDVAASAHGACAQDLEDDEVILRFLVHRDEIRCVARSRAGLLGAWPCSLTASEARDAAERLRFQTAKLQHGSAYLERHAATLDRSISALLDRLGEGLLAGPMGAVPREASLILMPHGVLHQLPLHAMGVGGVRLYETNVVSYARSDAQLMEARRASFTHGPRGAVAVCADRTLALPAIEAEARAVLRSYGGGATRVELDELLGFAAVARPDRPRHAALHLAAHGAYRADHPLFSGLLFGQRVLTAIDVEGLALRGAVVTLSGCETARHHVDQAEDPRGPERSFFAAGAAAVVGSLGLVEDRAAAHFMGELHGRLALGTAVGSAYCEALRSLATVPRGRLAGAAWVLTGDPRARVLAESES